jgi:hypothetical protein
MCGLVVDTVRERLRPQGVRLTSDASADLDIWRTVWQSNNLDADWAVAQEESLKVGRCPVLIWPEGDGTVNVTVEDSDEVIVAYSPGNRRQRVAALKSYVDEGELFATLYLPEATYGWVTEIETLPFMSLSAQAANVLASQALNWRTDNTQTGRNPLGKVPVVELLCKPNVKGVPMPELSVAVLRLQDRINKTMFDAIVSSEFGAFPLRYSIGIEIRRDKDGVPINPLAIGPNRVLALEAQDGQAGQIGQLSPFPLGDLLNLADASIKHLASVSQTPIYHLLSGLSNIGADTVRAAEQGHVSKVLAHQIEFGESAGEIFRMALLAMGDPEPPPDIALEWAPPETRSPAELADAAIKLSTSGYPFLAIARYMGASPSEVERLVRERAAELEAEPKPEPVPVAPSAPPAEAMPAIPFG